MFKKPSMTAWENPDEAEHILKHTWFGSLRVPGSAPAGAASPQIIHGLLEVFHYFHHPFWGVSPYFWKHPCVKLCVKPMHLLSMMALQQFLLHVPAPLTKGDTNTPEIHHFHTLMIGQTSVQEFRTSQISSPGPGVEVLV